MSPVHSKEGRPGATVLFATSLYLLIGTAFFGSLRQGAAEDASSGLIESQSFYSARPREEQPQGGWQGLPDGLSDLRASTCGNCHREIYEEWRVSTHAQAWTDAQFQSEIKKSGNQWLCNNCHTPLMNQMERWAVGLRDDDVERPIYTANAKFESDFRAEGITCAACHVRNGSIEGPTGIETDAHPTLLAERFNKSEICVSCHQAVRSYPGKDFVCVFETGDEWENGPYGRARQSCQVCHMQPVERPSAEGGPLRSGRRHYFPGSGIFKQPGLGPPLDQLGPGLGITVSVTPTSLIIRLENSFAGHYLPTGDPERFISVRANFFDESAAPVGAQASHRIGQDWKWWPEPAKLDDNRLAPLEVRMLRYPRPASAQSWSVVAESHRISVESAEYHQLIDYPRSRITHQLEGNFESD